MSQTMIRPAQQDVFVVPTTSVTAPVPATRSLLALVGAVLLAAATVYAVSLVIGYLGA